MSLRTSQSPLPWGGEGGGYLSIVKLRSQPTDINDNLHGFLHNLYRYKLVRTMEVNATSEDVRARQTFERKLCTIRTATNRLYLWSNVSLLHGTKD